MREFSPKTAVMMVVNPAGSFLIGLVAIWASQSVLADGPVLSPTDPTPTYVTIHAADAYAPDVIEDIARQSRIAIDVYENQPSSIPTAEVGFKQGKKGLWPTVTIQAEHRPFWDVLCEVCDRCKCRIIPGAADGCLSVDLEIGRSWRSTHGGAAVVLLNDIARPPGSTDPSDGMLWMVCLWEPRLDVVCRDSLGVFNQLSMWSPGFSPSQLTERLTFIGESYSAFHEACPEDGCGFAFGLPIRLPLNHEGKLIRLKGTIHLWVATKWEKAEGDYPSTRNEGPAVLRMSNGHRISVWNAGSSDDPAVNAKFPVARFDVSRGNLPLAEWASYRHLLPAAVDRNKISLRDAEGRQIPSRKTHAFAGDCFELSTIENDPEMATVFTPYDCQIGVGQPKKVIVSFPIERREIDVPYEFHDIPLEPLR